MKKVPSTFWQRPKAMGYSIIQCSTYVDRYSSTLDRKRRKSLLWWSLFIDLTRITGGRTAHLKFELRMW